ncbi:hypothetical protein F2N09_04055 [Campylobacter upsaliensis]|uniref:Uncharacterized protein n=1 Tax=Campylobacter upsaliensis TaxID=28080 RepID=A0A5L8SBU9_CAMUP|nr:hypothetical protein [Campylobacter upsaliensis]EAI2900905.1 hypothetical protein [Campylobacter upsaliensis]EAI9944862.1 hypothetical protein [Campylobacter upsaliensis]EAL3911307.1 hypothetical protein [Campylobacter upsaliensis]ECJ8454525.1 hypothetical protein [Campylobacter upsaliensis]ECV9716820.1 hypothetical protein [Campylobacter upsaliensis]
MLEEDFLKEKQNIRQKMLKYSRAMTRGIPMDEELKKEISSDDILRRRVKNKRQNLFDDELFETNPSKKSNIYLKEDLINVRLEEKQPLSSRFFVYFKKKNKQKNESKKEKPEKKKSLIFNLKKFKKAEKELKKKPLGQVIATKASTLNSSQNPPQKPQSKIPLEKENPSKKLEIKEEKKPLDIKTLQPQTEPLKEPQNESIEAKDTLLEGFSKATKEERNLNANHLLFASLLLSFALFLFVPQIYIRNQIYYLSREIATLKAEESVLNEENKELKRRLENRRFQNQILDYLE